MIASSPPLPFPTLPHHGNHAKSLQIILIQISRRSLAQNATKLANPHSQPAFPAAVAGAAVAGLVAGVMADVLSSIAQPSTGDTFGDTQPKAYSLSPCVFCLFRTFARLLDNLIRHTGVRACVCAFPGTLFREAQTGLA